MWAMVYPINSYRYTTSTYKPMECLNIDFIGPFPDKGYILVITVSYNDSKRQNWYNYREKFMLIKAFYLLYCNITEPSV